jgi:hypothetical protein
MIESWITRPETERLHPSWYVLKVLRYIINYDWNQDLWLCKEVPFTDAQKSMHQITGTTKPVHDDAS